MLTQNNLFFCITGFFLVIIAIPIFGQSLPSYQLSEFTIDPGQIGKHPTNIIQDSSGAVWISLYDNGLYRVLGNENTHFLRKPFYYELCGNDIYTMSIDHFNRIWISTQSSLGVCLFDNNVNSFDELEKFEIDPPFMVYSIFHQNSDITWLGCSDGVYKYDDETGYYMVDSLFNNVTFFDTIGSDNVFAYSKNKYKIFHLKNSEKNQLFELGSLEHWTDVPPIKISRNEYLITTDKTVKVLNLSTNAIEDFLQFDDYIYYFIKLDDHYLAITRDGEITIINEHLNKNVIFNLGPSNNVTQYFSDFEILNNGSIWFSWNGAIKCLKQNQIIKSFPSFPNKSNLNSNYITHDNVIYQIVDDTFVPLNNDRQKSENISIAILKAYKIKSVFKDKSDIIWFHLSEKFSSKSIIATFDFQSQVFNIKKEFNSFRVLFKNDIDGKLWVSTDQEGIFIFDENNAFYKKITSENSGLLEDWVNQIEFVGEDKVFIGHRSRGLILLDKSDFTLVHKFEFDPTNEESLLNNYVRVLLNFNNELLWVGTEEGLNVIDLQNFNILRWHGNKKVPLYGVVYNIGKDLNNNIWLEINNALYCLASPEFICYKISYDNSENDFFHFGFINDASGNLIIPGSSEVLYIDKNVDLSILQGSNVKILGFEVYNNKNERKYYPEKNYSNKQIEYKIPYNFNNFYFNFFQNNFQNSYDNLYQFKLEGKDLLWPEISNSQSAKFTNVPPGKYTFHVDGRNHLNIWSEQPAELSFTILPPWYWNITSQIIYFLLQGSLLYFLYQYLLKRKLAIQERNFEVQKLAYKSEIYSNITHEFRSPLTVIKGLSDRLADYFHTHQKTKFTQSLQLVRQNTERLLGLVNQFLDFDQNFDSEIQVHNKFGDIIPFIGYILDSYKSMAIDNQQELIEDLPSEAIYMDYDKDLIQKIISNLITNAIKFSPPFSTIKFNLIHSENAIKMEIIDQGKGIKKEDLPHIFERFYQSKENAEKGSGIGLALTYEIIQKLEGQLLASSEYGKGSTFTVILPKSKIAESFHSLNFESELTSNIYDLENVNAISDLPLILITDDSEDVIYYLKECLGNKYQLIFARDGEEGMEKALKYIPDFIISDHLMPNVSGITFIKQLKDNRITSHIPVLLLTAKTAEETRLQAYQAGADAFLEKPFIEKELLLRIEKLIELRNNLRNHFRGDISNVPEKIEKKEDEFIRQFKTIVQENIMQNLDVTFLCRALAVSRTQLHRKVKALTDLSTTELVKKIKLEKASELLKTTDLTISEIAYDTGFSSPSYFSKMFTKEYKISPTQFRSQ